jgi:hypothetical protein
LAESAAEAPAEAAKKIANTSGAARRVDFIMRFIWALLRKRQVAAGIVQ